MSEQIQKYLHTMPNIQIQKTKKKHIFIIKEAIYSFNIDLNKQKTCPICPQTNQCSLKKCYHFYQVLQYLGLNNDSVSFIAINDNLNRLLKGNDIVIHDSDVECNLCLSECWNSNISLSKIYQCLDCSKFYHNACLNQYKQITCPFCKAKFT